MGDSGRGGAKVDFNSLRGRFEYPVLILSTRVGRGNISIGEGIAENVRGGGEVHHRVLEDFLPEDILDEDFHRYRFISNNLTFLLYLIYTLPVFFYKKFFMEKTFRRGNLEKLGGLVDSVRPKTVICVSHRPSFWVSALKRRGAAGFKIFSVLSQFGSNIGYRFLFWDFIDGFISPVGMDETGIRLPEHVGFFHVDLPVRSEYYGLSGKKGDPNTVLVVCGFWGQGKIIEIVGDLRKHLPGLKIYAVCGDNPPLFNRAKMAFDGEANVSLFLTVESIAPLLGESASIITKPGFSTLLEAFTANRKIFLLKGMPVAEDQNADYAIKNFGAQWYSPEAFAEWLGGRA
jgi:UDP-N-acetylglucosamine:LPS N-acetylglucosamine transferase